MNTPKLDALLRDAEAEASAFVMIPLPEPSVDVEIARRLTIGRLAAMLRVAVEALQSNAACLRTNDGHEVSNCEWKALARIEQIAAESRSDDPEAAEEEAV